jgi:hypothetical protein
MEGTRPRPHYATFVLYGPFHRLEGSGRTQDRETAVRQLLSGEIWGRPSRYSGDVPLVQAHRGLLPPGRRGVEFLAFALPDKRWGAPEWRTEAWASGGQPLVWRETDPMLGRVIKLKVAITRVAQLLA